MTGPPRSIEMAFNRPTKAGKEPLISVEETKRRILADLKPLSTETRSLEDLDDRVLAHNLKALRTQPPFNASAMDGYAIRSGDLTDARALLNIAGESAAGHGYHEQLEPNTAVRIFTGAPLPPNADTIAIQENCRVLSDTQVSIEKSEAPGKYIRPAGTDFQEGKVLLKTGMRLNAARLALLASLGYAEAEVYRRPRVALLSTGDELVPAGHATGPDQIISSNVHAVRSIARRAGAEVVDLGIVQDDETQLIDAFERARQQNCDIIVTLGGASVGDHDLIRPVLDRLGARLALYKIAMRPGKPFMFGHWRAMNMMGLPGNPVSSLVCAHLFLAPLIRQLQGDQSKDQIQLGTLVTAEAGNDEREEYARALAWQTDSGQWLIEAFERQDSSLLSIASQANCLLIRPPFDEPLEAGSLVKFMFL